jgi:hypothetical protein
MDLKKAAFFRLSTSQARKNKIEVHILNTVHCNYFSGCLVAVIIMLIK